MNVPEAPEEEPHPLDCPYKCMLQGEGRHPMIGHPSRLIGPKGPTLT
jgi:hypothetical protein